MTGMQQSLLGSGGGGPRVAISDQLITSVTISPTVAQASYTLNSSGQASYATTEGGSVDITGEWRLSGASSDYEVRATVVSGSVSSGTTGSWLLLSTTRTWTRNGTAGFQSVELTIEIRDATTLAVLDTASITLEAETAI